MLTSDQNYLMSIQEITDVSLIFDIFTIFMDDFHIIIPLTTHPNLSPEINFKLNYKNNVCGPLHIISTVI